MLAFSGSAARQLRAPDDDALDAMETGRIDLADLPADAAVQRPAGGGDGTSPGDSAPKRSHLSLVPSSKSAEADDGAGDASESPTPASGLLDPGTVLAALHALAVERRDIQLATAFKRSLRLVALDAADPTRPVLTLASDAPTGRRFVPDTAASLRDWTGLDWELRLGEGGGPTLTEMETVARDARLNDASRDPDVAAILAHFPGARVTDVRPRGGVAAADDATMNPDDLDDSDEPDD